MRAALTILAACVAAAFIALPARGQTQSDTLARPAPDSTVQSARDSLAAATDSLARPGLGTPGLAAADSLAQTVSDSLAQAAPDSLAKSVPDSLAAAASGSLSITADADSVRILVDGVPRGFAPTRIEGLTPGPHVVRLTPPDPANWLTAAATDTVHIAAGTTVTKHYATRRWYSITSIPTGAAVRTDDSLAGVTPLLIRADRLTRDTRIALGGDGLRPAVASLDDFVRGTLLVRLEPVSPAEMADMLKTRELLPESPGSTGLYISGVASVAFGVAAAYFKGAADRAADEYLLTRDPALREKLDRMDYGAALSVVGMQIALGFFMLPSCHVDRIPVTPCITAVS